MPQQPRYTKLAFEAMLPYLTNEYGNPSSIHLCGRHAKLAIENARGQVASAIGAHPEEIYFTSGGTEADNWALKSATRLNFGKGKHMVSTAVEHHAVLHTIASLEEQGYESTCLGVDSYGQISTETLRCSIRYDTILISVVAANNEIGTVLPIDELAQYHGSTGFYSIPMLYKRSGISLLTFGI